MQPKSETPEIAYHDPFGLCRTYSKDRQAPAQDKKANPRRKAVRSKTVSTPATGAISPIIEIAGSQTPYEYGKPQSLADII